MAHPDDAELWMGATIAQHAHDGGRAIIVLAHDAGEPRLSEGRTGAEILGADVVLVPTLTVTSLAQALTEARPDVLVTHPLNDIHPGHRDCAHLVQRALPDVVIATGHPRRLYHCDGYNNLDMNGKAIDLPAIVDATSHWPTKIAALQAHTSQPIAEHFGPMAEALGRLHGARIETAYGEAFRSLPLLGRLPAAGHL
ncbi:PIG-L family deacetylase [Kineosporia rhizophila]|uniref:PIG-L deacetylase family protein n=1 Tax=Kineosporia rhizophila TaxID=84633 RepID=UPI001E56E222|nr:PIG-L family deacetylase [Kineosporia rhizophila]MCE0540747.1 PIG-L family deacetylase [Kineosporia rhizophila]